MNVLIRVDASMQIGSGHVMRCLSLADELRVRGAQVSFVCSKLPGQLDRQIQSRGYSVHMIGETEELPQDHWSWIRMNSERDAQATLQWVKRDMADLVVVDHYALDANWEATIRSSQARIVVIDDLADRSHDCDLLVDQNLYEDPMTRYMGRLSPRCQCLFGPAYALLREEFLKVRLRTHPRNGALKSILVSFGGVDATNETVKVLRGIETLVVERGLVLDVLIGPLCSHSEEIRRVANHLPGARVHENAQDVTQFMKNADLAFGAGGTTTWERCCLGVPTLVTLVAENQVLSVKALEREGAVRCLGRAEELCSRDYYQALKNLRAGELSEMSKKAMQLVDGQGGRRVVEHLFTTNA